MDTPVWGDLDLDKVSVPGEFVSVTHPDQSLPTFG
jgi:hypothetical protein